MVNIYLVKPSGLVVLSCDNMVSQLQKNFESDHSDYLFLEWHGMACPEIRLLCFIST